MQGLRFVYGMGFESGSGFVSATLTHDTVGSDLNHSVEVVCALQTCIWSLTRLVAVSEPFCGTVVFCASSRSWA